MEVAAASEIAATIIDGFCEQKKVFLSLSLSLSLSHIASEPNKGFLFLFLFQSFEVSTQNPSGFHGAKGDQEIFEETRMERWICGRFFSILRRRRRECVCVIFFWVLRERERESR